MANIIDQIMQFFTSDEFQALMTSIGSILLAISPMLYKIITSKLTKWKIKYDAKTGELKEAIGIIDEYKARAEAEALRAKQTIDELTLLINKQNEAMKLAFDRSNLKEDVKSEIGKMLKPIAEPILNAEKIINVARTALQEDEIKKDDTLPVETPIEKPKPKRVF